MSLVVQFAGVDSIQFIGYDSDISDFVFYGESEEALRKFHALNFFDEKARSKVIEDEDTRRGYRLRRHMNGNWIVQSLHSPILSYSGKDFAAVLLKFLKEEPVFRKIVGSC